MPFRREFAGWRTRTTVSGTRITRHPSLHFKKVKSYWVARVGEDYRAVGIEAEGTVVWFWIGPHDEYERMLCS